jgi:hypothetical protein
MRTLGVFASGCVVYAAMAACSGGAVKVSSNGSATGSGGHGGVAMGSGGKGTGGQHGAGGDSGMFDAFTDPVPSADAMPGSRLKGKYLLGDDGSKEYLYVPGLFAWQGAYPVAIPGAPLMPGAQTSSVHQLWYDSLRQEDCVFERAGDGKLRCLPVGALDWYFGYYADPQCTMGIAIFGQTPPGCALTLSKYVVLTETNGQPVGVCEESPAVSTKRIFLLGQPMSSPPPGVWRMQGGTCQNQGVNPIGEILFNVGAEVPPDSFVGATPMVDP